MKLVSLFIFALVFSLGFFEVHADPMPHNRAQAVLDDSRTLKTIEFLEQGFSAQCKIPQADRVNADVECFGKGDMGSCFYSFDIACPGEKGLARITIRAEFINIASSPLNMDITTRFQK